MGLFWNLLGHWTKQELEIQTIGTYLQLKFWKDFSYQILIQIKHMAQTPICSLHYQMWVKNLRISCLSWGCKNNYAFSEKKSCMECKHLMKLSIYRNLKRKLNEQRLKYRNCWKIVKQESKQRRNVMIESFTKFCWKLSGHLWDFSPRKVHKIQKAGKW